MPLLGLLLLATALRVHGLGSQLWLDEIDAVLTGMRRPILEIVTTWPRTTRNPLYDILGRACLLCFGESPVTVRLPAVAFGVGAVWMLYRLARDLFGPGVAMTAGALLAVSGPHVFYSQDARGYTALVFFFLAASRLLLRWHARGRLDTVEAVAYALSGALAAYSVLFGIFVLPGHALAALAARRREAAARDFGGLAKAVLAGLLLTALLYAPFTRSLLTLAERRPAEGLGFLYRLGVVQEALRGLSDSFLGPVGLVLAAGLALAGAAWWWRRHPFSLAALTLPALLELMAPAAGLPMSPRYFAIASPVVMLALACGLHRTASLLASSLPATRRRWLEAALVSAAVLATALPLRRYYRVPKQDFVGAIEHVGRLAGDGDARVAVHFASSALSEYYPQAAFEPVESLGELSKVEARGRRVWLVTTLEPYLASYDAALLRHIRQAYRLARVLPATVARAEVYVYVRESEPR